MLLYDVKTYFCFDELIIKIINLCCLLEGYGLVGDDEASGSGGTISVRFESSYAISLRDLEMNHVKDFTFAHGENFSSSSSFFSCV